MASPSAARIASSGSARLVGSLGQVEEADPRVGGAQPADLGSQSVGDPVTDQDHLEIAGCLAQHRVDGQTDRRVLVMGRDQHRRASHGRGPGQGCSARTTMVEPPAARS